MEQNLEDYLFDLRGYLHLKGAVSAELVTRLNTELDPYVSMTLNEWNGNIHRLKPDEIHNIIEAGQGFEELIDHDGVLIVVILSEGLLTDLTLGLKECHL